MINMRKIAGILVVSTLASICLWGCETQPTAKPVAPNTPAPGTAATASKNNASTTANAASSPMPTANPNYSGGGLGSKAK